MPQFSCFTPHFLTQNYHFSFSATPCEAFHPCHPCYPCELFSFSQIPQIPQIFVCSPLSFIIFGFAEDAHARHSSNKFDLCTRSTASFLIPNPSFGITLNITHFHPILFHIAHGAPLGLALNLSCRSPFARSQSLRYLTHTGVGVSPIHVFVSHPYTQRGLTHRALLWCSFSPPLVLL